MGISLFALNLKKVTFFYSFVSWSLDFFLWLFVNHTNYLTEGWFYQKGYLGNLDWLEDVPTFSVWQSLYRIVPKEDTCRGKIANSFFFFNFG